jgi:S-adenosylmethionine/arginine decarboxylase-like enzyme
MIVDTPFTHTARDPVRCADQVAILDAEILAQYHALAPWGMSCAIDLGGCDPRAIRDAGHLERFAIALCDLIEMRRYGEPLIVRFGNDPRVRGYSLAQLIETSLISGHFAEESNSAYIDVFSCKPYPAHRAAAFCQEWFGAATVRLGISFRSAGMPGSSLTLPCSHR